MKIETAKRCRLKNFSKVPNFGKVHEKPRINRGSIGGCQDKQVVYFQF